MAAKLFLVALAAPGIICTALNPLSEGNSTTRIIGGVAAREGDFPYAVSLQYSSSSKHFCTGSLLDPTTVLTAAHCLEIFKGDGYDPSNVYVRAGSTSTLRGGVVAGVSSMVVHWNRNYHIFAYDVGIVKLQKPIAPNNSIGFAALAGTGSDPDPGTMATAAGWGNTYPGDYNGSPLLQKVGIPIISRGECAALFRRRAFQRVTDDMVCAGYINDYDNGKDTCSGDSGGPLIDNKTGVMIGVVSWGSRECGGDGFVGVYARVGHFRDFIDSHME